MTSSIHSKSPSWALPLPRQRKTVMIGGWIHLLSCGLSWCLLFGSIPTTTSTSSFHRNHLEHHKLHNRFFAMRHGQSEANLAKVIASNPANATTNYGLSKQGRSQAKTAGQDLVQRFLEERSRCLQEGLPPPAGIYIATSDFLRAKQTAEALATAILEYNASTETDKIPIYSKDEQGHWKRIFHKDHCVSFDRRLRERWFGDYDGTSDSHYHCVWEEDVHNAHHTHREVESVWSVLHRATEFVCDADQDICQSKELVLPNTDHGQYLWIVCVAHGDVLQILQTAFCGMDPKNHRSLEHLETAILRPLEQE